MKTNICGVLFEKIDDNAISINDGKYQNTFKANASTYEEFIDSANFYFVHCY